MTMNFVCPKCQGSLLTDDGETARCGNHPGEFRILFSRWEPPPIAAVGGSTEIPNVPEPAFSLPEGAVCAQHPTQPAAYACGGCGMAVCTLCAFEDVERGHICPNCAAGRTQNRGEPLPSPIPAGMRCVQHTAVEATRQCRACGAFMCDTCDFLLAGGIHLCPSCATTPRSTLSSSRRNLVFGAYALAVWCTLATGLLFSGAMAKLLESQEDQRFFGILYKMGALVPSLIGLALGLCASDRRWINPPVVWIAIAWNGVIAAVLVLMEIIGTIKLMSR
jgi:hypothetical protein